MYRRHFLKLSGTTLASTFISRFTYLADEKLLLKTPDEVWAQNETSRFKLRNEGSGFTGNGISVAFLINTDSSSVFIQSQTSAVFEIQLKWVHKIAITSKILGDHWERTYGDVGWKNPSPEIKYPWYILLNDDKQTSGFGVKTGCNSICSWTLSAETLNLNIDTRSGGNGVLLGDRKLKVCELVCITNSPGESPFSTTQRFCRLMCESPKLPKLPVYGINDWYYAYGNNSAKLIKDITAIMANLVSSTENRPFSVIDAGWAQYSPYLPGDGGWADDFSKPNDKFKDMQKMANDIKDLGMRPGLWTRALCAKYNDNSNLLLPKIPGRDDPKNPVLDPTIPENLERVKNNISLYKQWGYEMVKHDYSTYDITGRWGFEMKDSITASNWSFYDKTKTTAEVINNLYRVIREAAGDMYLIGCNTISHLSAGVFELNRIGDDTSGKEWARTRKMGVNTLGFRMPQHQTFYAADGDCVGLTKDVAWAKNKQWMQLLAESSAPLFISAQPEALGTEQKDFIKQSFLSASSIQPIGEPLDWIDNSLPAKWKLNGRQVDFDWS